MKKKSFFTAKKSLKKKSFFLLPKKNLKKKSFFFTAEKKIEKRYFFYFRKKIEKRLRVGSFKKFGLVRVLLFLRGDCHFAPLE